MGQVFLFAFCAALNPTLLAAMTLMLSLDRPTRLIFGYLLGAYTMSFTLGLVIVFSMEDTAGESALANTVSPAIELTLGAIFLLIAFVLKTDRDQRVRERRQSRKEERPKREPRWRQMMSKGSARWTFVVGALLSFPGGSYLAALDGIHKLGLHASATVLLVVIVVLIQQLWGELPLIGYMVAPEWTQDAVNRFRAWLGRHARRFGMQASAVIGLLLVALGLIDLLT